ncbi:hypothetical protein [Pseudomonas sp. UMAB-08]|uniref:hypothetical protein n=1 Tax=Pseudomonas sp. UMAB-08 TaxID=1365375 RepID=UPI00214B6126|nr:hypothetical protein [Pseudomonas sp. UMAB-08]
MIKYALLPIAGLMMAGIAHAQPAEAINSQILLKTTSSWDGTPYVAYPQGQPELTVRNSNHGTRQQLRLAFPPNAVGRLCGLGRADRSSAG